MAADPAVLGPYGAAVGEGVLRLLVLAAGRPVAVIEDLHWADDDTLSVVEYIAGHIHGRAAALVVTQRTGENPATDAVGTRLGRSARSTTVDLSPLSSEAVDEIVASRLSGVPIPTELASDIRTFAEGLPLLVEQFLSCVLEDGSLPAGR